MRLSKWTGFCLVVLLSALAFLLDSRLDASKRKRPIATLSESLGNGKDARFVVGLIGLTNATKSPDSENGLAEAANGFKTRFTTTSSSASQKIQMTFPRQFDAPVTINSGNFEVSVRPVGGSNKSTGSLRDDILVYEEAFENCDAAYRACAHKTEEFLILHKPVANYAWTWELDLGAGTKILKPWLTPSHTIEMKDSHGVPRLRIDRPVGWDKAGKRLLPGRELRYTISDNRLTLMADLQGCCFPVVIDPTWSSTGTMSDKRSTHTLSRLPDGRILAAAGRDFPNAVNTSEIFDPSTGTWAGTGNLNVARYEHRAFALDDGKVLVVGGENGGYLGSCELFDPSTGLWTLTGSLSTIRNHFAAVKLSDGKVLVTGGLGSGNESLCELYDPSTGTWSITGSLQTGRHQHAISLLSDGKVLVSGGRTSAIGTIGSSEIYDPATGEWTATAGSLNNPRKHHASTALPDGKVIVIGGVTVTTGSPEVSEIFDPATGLWSTSGNLNDARHDIHNLNAHLLSNGKVIVIAGRNGLASCEVFDPSTSQWAYTASLSGPRDVFASIALDDGSILVSGGFGSQYLSTCEILNLTPQAISQELQFAEDSSGNSVVLTTDSIDQASFSITVQPSHGTLSGTAPNLSYTPNQDYFGSDSLKFTVSDSFGTSTEGVITINVASVNDQPSFSKGSDQQVLEDSGPQSIANWATSLSPGPANEAAQSLSFLVTNDNNALFSAQPVVAQDGTLSFTPQANAFGAATVFVQIKDDGGTASGGIDTSDVQAFNISVSSVNDAPTLNALGDLNLLEDAGLQTVNLTGITPGPSAGMADGIQGISITAISQDQTLVPDPIVTYTSGDTTGSLSFTPVANRNGTTTIVVTVADDGGNENGGINTFERAFQVNIASVNDKPSFALGTDQVAPETSNTITVYGFASDLVFGPSDEAGQAVSDFIVSNDSPSVFIDQPDIANDGTLSFMPANNINQDSIVTVTVRLRDDGGTANGGVDLSDPLQFTITLQRVADTLIVTNKDDLGAGSLRDCLSRARATDSISFDADVFALSKSHAATVINLLSELPPLDDGQVTIDGNNRRVTINGSAAPSANGFTVTSNGNRISGLTIVNFPRHGIMIDNCANNVLGGRRGLGLGPNGDGLRIANCGTYGILITGPNATGNKVCGVVVGLGLSGLLVSPNLAGIVVENGAHDNEIGCRDHPDSHSAISGNVFEGVTVAGLGSDRNMLWNLLVGRSLSGTDPSENLGNGASGIFLSEGTRDNTAGGTGANESNTVVRNGISGVEVRATQTEGNRFAANNIGLNAENGIALFDGSNGGVSPPAILDVTVLASLPDNKELVQISGWASAGLNSQVFVYNDSFSQGERRLQVSGGGEFIVVDSQSEWSGEFEVEAGKSITATVTDPSGNTSRFMRFGDNSSPSLLSAPIAQPNPITLSP